MDSTQTPRTYQRKSSYVHRKVAGTDVLISIGENIANFSGYIQLNPSAACIWEALREPNTAAGLARALEETFDIPTAQAEEDVAEFLRELIAHDMVLIR